MTTTPEDNPSAPESGAPSPPRGRVRTRRVPIALLLAVLAGVSAYFFWGKVFPLSAQGRGNAPAAPGARNGAPAGRPVPVVAAPARTGDIGVYLTGLGAVTPLNMGDSHPQPIVPPNLARRPRPA